MFFGFQSAPGFKIHGKYLVQQGLMPSITLRRGMIFEDDDYYLTELPDALPTEPHTLWYVATAKRRLRLINFVSAREPHKAATRLAIALGLAILSEDGEFEPANPAHEDRDIEWAVNARLAALDGVDGFTDNDDAVGDPHDLSANNVGAQQILLTHPLEVLTFQVPRRVSLEETYRRAVHATFLDAM